MRYHLEWSSDLIYPWEVTPQHLIQWPNFTLKASFICGRQQVYPMGETSIFNIIHWDPGRDPVTIKWPLTPPFYHTCTYRGFLSSPAAVVPLLSLRAKVWGLRFVNPLIGSLDAGAAPTGPGGGCWFDAPSVVVWRLGLPGKGWEQTRFSWRVKSSLVIWRNHWNRWYCNECWVNAKKKNLNHGNHDHGSLAAPSFQRGPSRTLEIKGRFVIGR